MTVLNRRRFLTISAACALTPFGARAAEVSQWSGRAMGAEVSMQLVGVGPGKASQLFAMVEAELERLEGIFSLFRVDSEISRLNRHRVLEFPSADLLQVLAQAGAVHQASKGRFDPTIQPVWSAHASGRSVDAARRLVGWSKVRMDTTRITQQGALTLNGIAQGYMTDRVMALLKAQGLRDVLVNMGEIGALGRRADGRAWAVGIADSNGQIAARLSLSDRAVATSAPQGTLVGEGQGHILSPDGGRALHKLVSISAPSATIADALSTAACLMPEGDILTMVGAFPEAKLEVLA